METGQSINQKSRRSLPGRLLSLIFVMAMLVAGVWAILNRQLIFDQITVWQFQPDQAVSALADEAGMNDRGRFLFYASRPELNNAVDFNNNCQARESQSIVLGCYASGRIFIFKVTDERISGVKTVTAAHEMLHAAYERLSDNERTKLDQLLETEFAKTTDPDILDLVKLYDKTEPGERWNELHSIFGTEVADLPPELETYYARYFADRSQVVAAYSNYHQIFADLKARAMELQNQLTTKKTVIDNKTTEYNTKLAQLDADVKTFNQKAAMQGGFASQSEFNSTRAALLARQTALTALGNSINALVDEYNQAVVDLNALGVEMDTLNQNLDSHAETID